MKLKNLGKSIKKKVNNRVNNVNTKINGITAQVNNKMRSNGRAVTHAGEGIQANLTAVPRLMNPNIKRRVGNIKF
jgi:hypothetical protein